MNTRKFTRSFIALFLIASSSGAWAQIYVNDLKNQASINQEFTVFNALNNNSTFSANPSYGLELLSTPPQSGTVAIYRNTFLSASQNHLVETGKQKMWNCIVPRIRLCVCPSKSGLSWF
jgi:predicted double-glycine peptidase